MRHLVLGLCLVGCAAEPEFAGEVVESSLPPDVMKVMLEPAVVDFGAVKVGEGVLVQVDVLNTGSRAVSLSDLVLSPAGEGVRLPLDAHQDLLDGVELYEGESYTVDVWFEPEVAGSYAGFLEVEVGGGPRRSARIQGDAQ